MTLDHDEVQLFFEEAGSGLPPILFIHGWGGDHTYMAPQFEYFRRRHRIVNVDLRGFGQSDKPDQAYTMAGYADELAWMCQRLDLQKPVVVSHSMGARSRSRSARVTPSSLRPWSSSRRSSWRHRRCWMAFAACSPASRPRPTRR